MKRILQKSVIGIALTLMLAAAAPALAASTCSNTTALSANLSECLASSELSCDDILSKLAAGGLVSPSQLEKYGLCENGTNCTDTGCPGTQADPVNTASSNCPAGTTAACTQADCDQNGCDTADCAANGCTAGDCGSQCTPAQTADVEATLTNAVASAVKAPATTTEADTAADDEAAVKSAVAANDIDRIKDTVRSYVAGNATCPNGNSSCPSSSSTCPNGSSSGSAVKSANIADIQAAIEKACSQSGSSCPSSAQVSDVLNALQNSGLSSCNK